MEIKQNIYPILPSDIKIYVLSFLDMIDVAALLKAYIRGIVYFNTRTESPLAQLIKDQFAKRISQSIFNVQKRSVLPPYNYWILCKDALLNMLHGGDTYVHLYWNSNDDLYMDMSWYHKPLVPKKEMYNFYYYCMVTLAARAIRIYNAGRKTHKDATPVGDNEAMFNYPDILIKIINENLQIYFYLNINGNMQTYRISDIYTFPPCNQFNPNKNYAQVLDLILKNNNIKIFGHYQKRANYVTEKFTDITHTRFIHKYMQYLKQFIYWGEMIKGPIARKYLFGDDIYGPESAIHEDMVYIHGPESAINGGMVFNKYKPVQFYIAEEFFGRHHRS
jgi:hypothetical protein